MGRCESANASIGIKILLSTLVLQIKETNFSLIKEMLYSGFIEDENDYFNDVYGKIIGENKLPENYLELKEWLTQKLTTNGSYYISHGHSTLIQTLDKGCLFDKYLLVPVKVILTQERWGYDRDGLNCISRPIDFNLSVNIEKYKEIEKTEIVFLLRQYSE
jgi:hypothetical protein